MLIYSIFILFLGIKRLFLHRDTELKSVLIG